MASSGRINSGTANFSYFYFQWQLASQSIASNTSTINWQWGLNISNSAYWGSNSVKSVSGYINGGQAIGSQTWSNISGNGDHHLRTGSWTIGHNGNGTKNFGMSSTGWLYANGNLSNSGSWDLPTIPRHATLTGLSMDASGITAYDEGPMWLEFSNPAGTAVDAFLEAPDGSNRIYTSASGIASRFNFPFDAALIQEFQQATPNSNSFTVRIGIHDSLGGDNWDFRDRTYYIKNDVGQANPTFSDFTYEDMDSLTTSVTGDDQVLVQGKSYLRVTVSTANKATANKHASMSNYVFSIGGYSASNTYSSVLNVLKTVGTVSDVTGEQNLSVKAVDSRSNSTTVTKTVTILPYSSPSFVPSLSVGYTNDFDNSDGLTVTANGSIIANISPLTLLGVDKNILNTTTGVQFDLSKDNNTSYTGTYVNVTTTQSAGTGEISTNLTTLASAILTKMNGMTADNDVRWYIKFKIAEEMEVQYYETYIDIGRSIFRIGTDGYTYNNEQPLMPSHVGQIIMSVSLTTAGDVGAIYNGTWVAWGTGRSPVGVDTGQSEFNTVEETGGAKTHTLTTGEMPSHTHGQKVTANTGSNGRKDFQAEGPSTEYDQSVQTYATGGGGAHNNLGPYITCYFWKRTV